MVTPAQAEAVKQYFATSPLKATTPTTGGGTSGAGGGNDWYAAIERGDYRLPGAPVYDQSTGTASPAPAATPAPKAGFMTTPDYSDATKGGFSGIWNDIKHTKLSDVPGIVGAGLYGGAQAAVQTPVNVVKGAANIVKGIATQAYNTPGNLKNIVTGVPEIFKTEFSPGGGGIKGVAKDFGSGTAQVAKSIANPVINKIGSILSNPASTLNEIHSLSVEHPLETAITVKMLFDLAKKFSSQSGKTLNTQNSQDVPIDKIKDAQGMSLEDMQNQAEVTKSGLNQTGNAAGMDESSYHGARLGRQVTEPVSMTANEDGTYSITDGNHRLRQALINGDKTIPATVQNSTPNLAGVTENNITAGIDKAIEAGDVPRETVYAKGDTLAPEFAKGRIDDIAQVLDKSEPGLGAEFRSAVNPKNVTFEGLRSAVNNVADPSLAQQALGTIDKGISTVGQAVINPATKVASMTATALKNMVTKPAKFTVSHLTGLDPQTIDTAINNPDALSEAEKTGLNRQSLANKVQTALKSRLDDLSSTGKEYNKIKKSGVTVDFSAPPEDMVIPEGGSPDTPIQNVLQKYGLTIDDQGTIQTTAESVPLKPGDQAALQSWINQYGKPIINDGEVSANGLLNSRRGLDNLADWGEDKTDVSGKISRDLRYTIDQYGKDQIPGLAEVDAKYSPEVQELNKLSSEYLNADGTLKDSALNKIANITGKGKDPALARLQTLVPDIKQQVQVLKSIEDIDASMGTKVGTYVRAGASGTLVATGHPILGIASFLLGVPKIAIPIIESYGKLKGLGSDTINAITSKIGTTQALTKAESLITAQSMLNYLRPSSSGTDNQADNE